MSTGAVTITSLLPIPTHNTPPRQRKTSRVIGRSGAAQHAIKRQQVKHAHERLVSMDDVRDALGLQRMNDPDQRRRERNPGSGMRKARMKDRQQQGSSNDAEKGQPAAR